MPTALELTREEWQPYIDAACQRDAVPTASPDEQYERECLLDRVRTTAAQLKACCGAKRVILFGSLAHAAWFTPDSDIDLAIEGVTADQFWHAWRLAEDLIPGRSVDLIEIETATESLLQAIERQGIDL